MLWNLLIIALLQWILKHAPIQASLRKPLKISIYISETLLRATDFDAEEAVI